MASYAMEDFVGNGVLKGQLPKLLEEGWDDVPTLKIMNAEDMDAINMTQQQKVGLYCESASHSPSPPSPPPPSFLQKPVQFFVFKSSYFPYM